MREAIGAVLAFAVGVGISPIPIIAVILMLFSERAKVNGPMFMAGWVIGLSAVFAIVYVVASALDVGTDPDARDGVSWLKIGLGVLLLVAAVRKWRSRPQPGDEAAMPAWMTRVDKMSPAGAGGLALLLSANPKNLLLALGAATSVAELDVSGGDAIAAGVAFVAVGSAIVVLAVVYDLVGGESARRTLDDAKSWLSFHNSAVMAVLFLVFAAVLISDGLRLRG